MTTLHDLFMSYHYLFGLQAVQPLDACYPLRQCTLAFQPQHQRDEIHLLCHQPPARALAVFTHSAGKTRQHIQYQCAPESLALWLAELMLDPVVTLAHGVLIEMSSCGILIQGASGIGKTQLALALLSQGACLICDDAPYLLHRQHVCIGLCPPKLEGFAHSHRQGFINLTQVYGAHCWKRRTEVNLIIRLRREPGMRDVTHRQIVSLPAHHPQLARLVKTAINDLS